MSKFRKNLPEGLRYSGNALTMDNAKIRLYYQNILVDKITRTVTVRRAMHHQLIGGPGEVSWYYTAMYDKTSWLLMRSSDLWGSLPVSETRINLLRCVTKAQGLEYMRVRGVREHTADTVVRNAARKLLANMDFPPFVSSSNPPFEAKCAVEETINDRFKT